MTRRPSDPFPDFIDPQLATLVQHAPEGDQWLHEIKLDGYRTGTRIERGKVRMLTRHANDWTARFRPIAALLTELPAKTAYLDGEIAVLTSEGIFDFGALQEALGRHGSSKELAYILFDHPSSERPRPAPAAPDRAQGHAGKAPRQAAGAERRPILRRRDRSGSRVLRPRL